MSTTATLAEPQRVEVVPPDLLGARDECPHIVVDREIAPGEGIGLALREKQDEVRRALWRHFVPFGKSVEEPIPDQSLRGVRRRVGLQCSLQHGRAHNPWMNAEHCNTLVARL